MAGALSTLTMDAQGTGLESMLISHTRQGAHLSRQSRRQGEPRLPVAQALSRTASLPKFSV
ncbi:hypothetical protein JZ751_022975 [Albula glossodonta]|uniref:Uncharacterized protein n=1 Tax=Albula glossodonta TaxID=121402 RepID=A0A8T2PGV3_9TELE|nr:hypothetical protein JZ751_022975 [Albula glossodonta]